MVRDQFIQNSKLYNETANVKEVLMTFLDKYVDV